MFDRIHWPQAVLLIVTLLCMAIAPVAFFALVPERIIDKIFDLPWSTILAVGTPLLVGTITALRSAFTGPLMKDKSETPSSS